MPSNVLHASPDPSVERNVRELLVLWQHPETREIIPVGRLGYGEGLYTFTYTQAARAVGDFRPLPGLGSVGRRTASETLPAIFRLRVMDPERPDYAGYLATLGLSQETATPWEQIVHSGGERVGDTLQFMEVPEIVGGWTRARFLANGVRHIPGRSLNVDGQRMVVSPEAHESALSALKIGSELQLVPELDNQKDRCATLVSTSGIPLGWVPRALSTSVRELLGLTRVTARVVRVNGPSTPAHLRLVLDLVAHAPDGFQFDREGTWEPA